MASDLVPLVTRYGRGLNLVDAPDALGDGQARRLENFRITGRGWLSSRKAAVELSAPDGDVVGIYPYDHTGGVGAVLLVWDSALALVELWTVDGSGGSATLVGTLPGYASGVTSRPRFTGAVLGRVLFVADVLKTHGLTLYDPGDVLGSGAAGGLYQPTFQFEPSSSGHDEAFPRVVVEHQNHLWMFGYGSEADPNRGEVARFSYLGLLDDAQGAGDAGIGGAAGSEDIFDTEDAVPVGPRGEEVIDAKSANGRLVVCTERRASVIYGSGRSSWRLDTIDNQRGCVVTGGMVEADGVVYWLSPLGPCRYRGGAVVEDLSQLVDPLLSEIDFASVVAAQHPDEHQVRWYYRRRTDTTAGADRWFGWDYQNDEWVSDTLSYRVFAAGTLRPSGEEGPAAAPSSLAHVEITDRSAKATWVNGDTSPGTRTRVYRAPDNTGVPGTYELVATVDSGAGSYRHTGLAFNTPYWTKVEHIRNGQVSAAAEATFTTLTTTDLAAPTNLQAEDSPVLQGGAWTASVFLTWDSAYDDVKFFIDRNANGAGWVLLEETGFGTTSFRDNDVVAGTPYEYRVSLEDRDGNTSPESASALVTPTTDDPFAGEGE